jgi:hypothetical protein
MKIMREICSEDTGGLEAKKYEIYKWPKRAMATIKNGFAKKGE